MRMLSVKRYVASLLVFSSLLMCMVSDKNIDEPALGENPMSELEKLDAKMELQYFLFGDNSSGFIPLPDFLSQSHPLTTNEYPIRYVDDNGDPIRHNPDDRVEDLEIENIANVLSTTPAFQPTFSPETSSTETTVTWQGQGFFGNSVGPTYKYSLISDIEKQLESENAKNFIESLTNDFQRDVVLANLRTCPFRPLCHFALDLDATNYQGDVHSLEQCCLLCSCSRACIANGDCCPDVTWFIQKPPVLPQGVKQACLPSEIRRPVKDTEPITAKVVTGCPIHTAPHLVSKCVRHYETVLPTNDAIELEEMTFVSSLSKNLTYRNKYCAECNNVDPTSLIPWLQQLECFQKDLVIKSSNMLLAKIMNDEISCIIKFGRPEEPVNIEYCSTSGEISRCNVTGLWGWYDPVIERACSLYGSPIVVRSRLDGYVKFRNTFCAQCNGYQPSPIDMCAQLHDNTGVVDFSGLLRLEKHQPEVERVCGKGEQYDEIKEKCRTVICSNGREHEGDLCRLIVAAEEDLNLDIVLRLQPLENVQLKIGYEMVPALKFAVISELKNALPDVDICGTQVFLQSNLRLADDTLGTSVRKLGHSSLHAYLNDGEFENQVNESELIFCEMRIQINLYKSSRASVFDSLVPLNGSVITLNETGGMSLNETSVSMHMFKLRFAQGNSRGIKLLDDIGSIGYFLLRDTVNYEDDVINIHDVVEYLLLFDNIDGTVQFPYLQWNDEFALCMLYKTRQDIFSIASCPMFRIPWSDFKWKVNQHGLGIVGSTVQLDISDFTIEVDESFSTNVLICGDTYHDQLKPLQFNHEGQQDDVQFAKVVISIACVSISVICLIISLVTFCLFKQLQTIPGKNNIALIIALMSAHSLYLLGGAGGFDKDSPVCKTIGLLTHFFWLLAIFWMNACTFHMCRVLVRTRNMSRGHSSKRHYYYHLYCTTMALLFVITNVTVSMATSNSTDMGYGKVICFVSTQLMIDLTFGIPAALVVVANLCMFLAIVITLKGSPSIQKNVKHDRNYLLVFIKLSSVTGITWVFGFIYMWTGLEVFSFLFIIFNASQGIFIMLAFVCNKRTMALYKDRCLGRSADHTLSSNRSGKTMSTST